MTGGTNLTLAEATDSIKEIRCEQLTNGLLDEYDLYGRRLNFSYEDLEARCEILLLLENCAYRISDAYHKFGKSQHARMWRHIARSERLDYSRCVEMLG